MDADLYSHLCKGGLVLTVNNRLARQLREDYDQRRADEKAGVWLRPQVFSLAAWSESRIRSLREDPEILSQAQSLRIWVEIIEADQARHALLQLHQTARRAFQAHQLLVRYGVNFDAEEAGPDSRAFLRWRSRWQRQAARRNWTDAAVLIRRVAGALAEKRCAAPGRVLLAGFDHMVPDVALLVDVLRGLHCEVHEWNPAPANAGKRSSFAAADPRAEVCHCARWVRRIRESEPQARIGIVVPRLEDYRRHFATVFQDELDPAGVLQGVETHTAFNISLAGSVGDEGPVRAALRLLQTGRRLTTDDFGWLLRSPYIGRHRRDASRRARLDKALRESGVPEWTLAALRRFAVRFSGDQEKQPFDAQSILAMLAARDRSRSSQLPGDWAESFVKDLREMGWPGDRGLSSREYQAAESWHRLLADLASLDRVSQPMQRREAVAALTRLAADTEFQPESQGGEIQVLGLLEAGGMSFDHLWVAGLHDGALPQPPQPNPFIPLAVQQRAGMERADAVRERLFAERVANRLFHAAPEVVLSWPRLVDGIVQRPSPLLPGLDADGMVLADPASPATAIHSAGRRLETLADCRAPALNLKKTFAGGTGLLKDQALCPFRAFAHYRLHARRLESPEIGLDNLCRGSLVHYALEFFWKKVETQSALRTLSRDERENAVRQAVASSLDRFEREKRRDLPAGQKAIERRRLTGLLTSWLEFEAERPPFVVQSLEKSLKVAVGRLTIRTRVDRIDLLEDGSLAILDYKTGRCDPAQWFDERLTEPQLPVYCLSGPSDRIGAVMFAQVRSRLRECGFRGVTRSDEPWPGQGGGTTGKVLEAHGWQSFDAIIDHWRAALERLGNAFAAGDAEVDPVSPEAACRYCDLAPLCRIHEAGTTLHLPEART